jgi:NAD(P)-dependent dehydrogenase (short-subunit alcohol dehydrogenase family)
MGASAALDTDPEKLKAMFDVNVVGPLRMIQGFAPALAKSAKSGSRAKVLNIGTVLSGGAPWHTGYASSKVRYCVFIDIHELISRRLCR